MLGTANQYSNKKQNIEKIVADNNNSYFIE